MLQGEKEYCGCGHEIFEEYRTCTLCKDKLCPDCLGDIILGYDEEDDCLCTSCQDEPEGKKFVSQQFRLQEEQVKHLSDRLSDYEDLIKIIKNVLERSEDEKWTVGFLDGYLRHYN
jgi:hypothetical protein